MTLLSITQDQILSVILLVVFLLLIYLMFKFLKNSKKKSNESRMLSLNLVIRYKDFLKYLEYKESVKEDYSIYMVSINNFEYLLNKYPDNIIRLFIRRIVKNLSVMLPYGGKLAQTKERNTFVLYVPKMLGNEAEFANMLKQAAVTSFEFNEDKILENISIGYQVSNNPFIKRLEEAYLALIHSRRNLGLITKYEEYIPKPDNNYFNLESTVESLNIIVNKKEVIRTNINKTEGIYLNININSKPILNFLTEQPQQDSSWINLYIINKVLKELNFNQYTAKLYLPILLSTLESENFIEALNIMLKANNLSFNIIALSVKNSIISKRNNIIKNILKLKELGVLISYDTKILDQEIYNTIQSYGFNSVEIYGNGNIIDEKIIIEINNYAKVNQINTLLISDDEKYLNYCTHHTKKLEQVIINKTKQAKKKWSR